MNTIIRKKNPATGAITYFEILLESTELPKIFRKRARITASTGRNNRPQTSNEMERGHLKKSRHETAKLSGSLAPLDAEHFKITYLLMHLGKVC